MDERRLKTNPDEPIKFRFGSRQLFYATALIAAGLALGPGTILVTIIVLVGWTVVFLQQDRRRALFWTFVVLAILFCLGGFMMPAVQQVREAARRTMCANNMRQIMLAIMNYEAAYGHFPTDRIVSTADGTELRHSWRVLILPFLENQNVYDLYDFNEPWDGPNNRKLESRLSWSVFQCPSHDSGNKTPYKLVVGPGTAFEAGKPQNYGDVRDGSSNTIALIEDTANPVSWMEPSDVTVAQAVKLLNGLDRNTCSHMFETPFERRWIGSNIVMLDGAIRCWTPNTNKPISAGAFLVNDGILFDHKNEGTALVEIKYGGYVALGVYIFLVVLPAFYLRYPKRSPKLSDAVDFL